LAICRQFSQFQLIGYKKGSELGLELKLKLELGFSAFHMSLILVTSCLFLVCFQSIAFGGNIPQAMIYYDNTWDKFKEPEPFSPAPPLSDTWKTSDVRMYVAISHYRDFRCPYTLLNLFNNAKHPEHLRVGLIQQLRQETHDKDCVKVYCQIDKNCHQDRIKTMEMSAIDSKGPSFAYYLHSLMLEDEDFYLQIDSHMDFVEEWDVKLLNEWKAARNEYAVLSTHPPDVKRKNDAAQDPSVLNEVPYLCEATITSAGLVRNKPAYALVNIDKPILSPLWSSMFSFSRAHAIRRVPSDPVLMHAYDGVEFATYARLWTRGYDVYAPSKVIVFHDYKQRMGSFDDKTKNNKAKGQEHVEPIGWTENGMSPWHKRKMFEDSKLRIKTLLGAPGGDITVEGITSLTRFGLGTVRDLNKLIAFSGVDTKRGKVSSKSKCLGGLTWVPPSDAGGMDPWGGAWEMREKGGPNIPLKSGPTVFVDMSDLWHEIQDFKKNKNGNGNGKGKGIEPGSDIHIADEMNNEKGNEDGNYVQPSLELDAASDPSNWRVISFPGVVQICDILRKSLRERLGPNFDTEKALKVLLLLIPLIMLIFALAFHLLHQNDDIVINNVSNSGISKEDHNTYKMYVSPGKIKD